MRQILCDRSLQRASVGRTAVIAVGSGCVLSPRNKAALITLLSFLEVSTV